MTKEELEQEILNLDLAIRTMEITREKLLSDYDEIIRQEIANMNYEEE